MATIDEINAQKQAAADILDRKIYDGIALKNAGGLTDAERADLDAAIHQLMVRRQAVYVQAYEGAMGSVEMNAALRKLQAATAEMNTVAARMKTATDFIANAADLADAARKVVTTLKGK